MSCFEILLVFGLDFWFNYLRSSNLRTMSYRLFTFFSLFFLFTQVGFAQDGLSDVDLVEIPEEPEDEGKIVCYTVVETMPEYPGGNEALLNFIAKNVKYPSHYKAEWSSTVYIRFIVDEKGNVINPEIIRGENEALNQAALDVVKLIKGFSPGMQKGKPSEIAFTLPIHFN